MSKAYRRKPCVYCVVDNASTTADHVIAKSFFPSDLRAKIPKVPACSACNNAKSGLEHYLATVLPFGGRCDQSLEILKSSVERRLERNHRVRRELTRSWGARPWITTEGRVQLRHTFNVDADKIEELYRLIVRGLCWHEWRLLLPPATTEIQVGFLNPSGEEMIGKLFGMNAKRRCQKMLGGGLFQYEGAQALDDESITIWRMSLYGVRFIDGDRSIETSTACYASTAPNGKALPIGAS